MLVIFSERAVGGGGCAIFYSVFSVYFAVTTLLFLNHIGGTWKQHAVLCYHIPTRQLRIIRLVFLSQDSVTLSFLYHVGRVRKQHAVLCEKYHYRHP
jgi:hypothetical protein